MRGSVYQRRRRCGRQSCACAKDSDALHTGTFLTVFLDGRTRGFHLRAEGEERAQQAVAAYNRLWKLVNELTACEVAELRRRMRIDGQTSSLGSLAARCGWATSDLPCGPQPDTRHCARYRGEGERQHRDRPLTRAMLRRHGLAVTKRAGDCPTASDFTPRGSGLTCPARSDRIDARCHGSSAR
jgi:hypothetical protein